MRTLLLATVLFVGLSVDLSGAIAKPSLDLTVVLNFKGSYSTTVIGEMETETARILGSSGVRLHWSTLGAGSFDTDLVVMTFTGSCRFGVPKPPQSSPLAATLIVSGRITPFGQVYCDRVVGAARSAMSAGQYSGGERLTGRALGRVVAHELFHMLTGSRRHGLQGVEQPALTGEELISDTLSLSMMDTYRVRRELKNSCRLEAQPASILKSGCRVLEQTDFNAN